MKKAFLVDFNIRTRVVVEVGDKEDISSAEVQDRISAASKNKILAEPSAYIIDDNIVEVEVDEEMPYDEEFDK